MPCLRQGSQRRHSSLPSFGGDMPAADVATQQPAAPLVFLPAAASAANGYQRSMTVSTDDTDLEPPSAR